MNFQSEDDRSLPLELFTRCPNDDGSVDRARFAAAASGIAHIKIEDEKISMITRNIRSDGKLLSRSRSGLSSTSSAWDDCGVKVKESFRYLYPEEEVSGIVSLQLSKETVMEGITIVLKAEEHLGNFVREASGISLKDSTTVTLWRVEEDLQLQEELDGSGRVVALDDKSGFKLKPGLHRWKFCLTSPAGYYAPSFTTAAPTSSSGIYFGTAAVQYRLLAVINRCDKEKDNPFVNTQKTTRSEPESLPEERSMVDLSGLVSKDPRLQLVTSNSARVLSTASPVVPRSPAEVRNFHSDDSERAISSMTSSPFGSSLDLPPSRTVPKRQRREETLEDDYDIVVKGSGIKIFRKRADLFPRAEVRLMPFPGAVPPSSATDMPVLVRKNMPQIWGGFRGLNEFRVREALVALDKSSDSTNTANDNDLKTNDDMVESLGSDSMAADEDQDDPSVKEFGGVGESDTSPLNYALARLKVKTKRGALKRKAKSYAFIKVYSDRFYAVQGEEFPLFIRVNNGTPTPEVCSLCCNFYLFCYVLRFLLLVSCVCQRITFAVCHHH